jgi:hypothetical protein
MHVVCLQQQQGLALAGRPGDEHSRTAPAWPGAWTRAEAAAAGRVTAGSCGRCPTIPPPCASFRASHKASRICCLQNDSGPPFPLKRCVLAAQAARRTAGDARALAMPRKRLVIGGDGGWGGTPLQAVGIMAAAAACTSSHFAAAVGPFTSDRLPQRSSAKCGVSHRLWLRRPALCLPLRQAAGLTCADCSR